MCSGPNHAATCSGSVHASNTRSRGASKTRVTRTCSSVGTCVGSFTLALLSAQMCVQAIHPALPGLLSRLNPREGLVQRLGLHTARAPLRVSAAHDQTCGFEHLQVVRDRGLAHREGLCQLVHGCLAFGQTAEHRTAGRIRECSECETELVGWH